MNVALTDINMKTSGLQCPVPQSVVTLSVIVPEIPQVSLVLFLSSP